MLVRMIEFATCHSLYALIWHLVPVRGQMASVSGRTLQQSNPFAEILLRQLQPSIGRYRADVSRSGIVIDGDCFA